MTRVGRGLYVLQQLNQAVIVAVAGGGYAAGYGLVGIGQHISWGFFGALLIAFAHAMTVFYFAGIGVNMREAARGRAWCLPYLATGSEMRRMLAVPLGTALVCLMAAVILGGGIHTQRLPSWPHHGFALAALALNFHASRRAARLVRENEALIRDFERELERRRRGGDDGMD